MMKQKICFDHQVWKTKSTTWATTAGVFKTGKKSKVVSRVMARWQKKKIAPIKSKRSKRDQRSVYVVIGHSCFSPQAKIPLLIKRLCKRCKLKWLHVLMAYHWFLNIREKFSGDLSTKLNCDVIS
eukprot:5004518-Ditylum_brightwellii.AAC.2